MSRAERLTTTTATTTARTRGGNPQARLEARWGYLMIAPMLIGFTVFFLIALGVSFVLGFTEWKMIESPRWVGLQNYRDVLRDAGFRTALVNTLAIAVPLVVLRLTIGLALATALNSKIRFRAFYRVLFFLPVVTMPVAIGTIWKWLYDPGFGPINAFLGNLGLVQPNWLTERWWAIAAVVIVLLWSGVGYDMIIYLAGLQAIPRDYYDAAAIDGAGPFRTLVSVILPQAWPAVIAVSIFTFVYSWNDFFGPLIYLAGHDEIQPLQVGLSHFNGIYHTRANLIQAGNIMTLFIAVILFVIFQRVFIRGIVITGVEK